jgi:hypothetical protein
MEPRQTVHNVLFLAFTILVQMYVQLVMSIVKLVTQQSLVYRVMLVIFIMELALIAWHAQPLTQTVLSALPQFVKLAIKDSI